MPYVLALLFFTADYIAPEEMLAAGIKGYQQRADTIRKKAVTAAEAKAKELSDKAAAMKRAKIDAALVGTPDSAGKESNGAWKFGTSVEKGEGIAAMTRGAVAWREMAADLKAKKIWPQLQLRVRGIVPSATGTFPNDIPLRLSFEDIDFAEFTMLVNLEVDAGTPIIRFGGSTPLKFRLKHGGVIDKVDAAKVTRVEGEPQLRGVYALFRGVYQFVGIENGKLLFHRIESLPVGRWELSFPPD